MVCTRTEVTSKLKAPSHIWDIPLQQPLQLGSQELAERRAQNSTHFVAHESWVRFAGLGLVSLSAPARELQPQLTWALKLANG